METIRKVEYSDDDSPHNYFIKRKNKYIQANTILGYYNDLENVYVSEIPKNYNYIAYINDRGDLDCGECFKVYSKYDKIHNFYVYIEDIDKEFEIDDVTNLSNYLKYFDEFNIDTKLVDIITSKKILINIKKKINSYKKFKSYWMKKYYKG